MYLNIGEGSLLNAAMTLFNVNVSGNAAGGGGAYCSATLDGSVRALIALLCIALVTLNDTP